jgi:quercetin 2,3-dioxygenase
MICIASITLYLRAIRPFPRQMETTLKGLADILHPPAEHWVGDGFAVRTIFSYDTLGTELSPFLLLDYASPRRFTSASRPRGIGPHPHRGFETVTIVYEGEVAHRDSTGQGGIIGPGDVQWMTAGAGIVHQEFHSPAFTQTGGPFQMVQLWVNLPAEHKSTPPAYQAIKAAAIPSIELPHKAGRARIIAGAIGGTVGSAHTFTPINVWDLTLTGASPVILDVPEGHTTLIVVLSGTLVFGERQYVCSAQAALLTRAAAGAVVVANEPTQVLILTGAPIEEPIVGRGPFVMNSEAQIRQAFLDFGSGRFGALRDA